MIIFKYFITSVFFFSPSCFANCKWVFCYATSFQCWIYIWNHMGNFKIQMAKLPPRPIQPEDTGSLYRTPGDFYTQPVLKSNVLSHRLVSQSIDSANTSWCPRKLLLWPSASCLFCVLCCLRALGFSNLPVSPSLVCRYFSFRHLFIVNNISTSNYRVKWDNKNPRSVGSWVRP